MKQQNGFTLVELAIALMVIGLLIGGVLKGQELIESARMTQTIRDLESYNTATMIFQNTYNSLPGDIKKPQRIPNCTSTYCLMAGDGNKKVGDYSDWGNENKTYWLHLAQAGMLSGIDQNATWSSPEDMDTTVFPETKLGGHTYIYNVNVNQGNSTYPQGVKGNYYYLGEYSTSSSVMEGAFTIATLSRLDEKLDDGKPRSGDVMALHCATIADGSNEYPAEQGETLCPAMSHARF